ncbi:hypothetical protein GYMLUDRAFT_436627 [Collybiopsis luxurians FD-317 M1]|uniref:Uncharacterized protein n=1 Tax=Collybiopsis luxurians FD-317 M1 TaxID=944289 RepID=A0A0D0CWJ1_9AGAR|nr:hypothetical protein GYMLUDRAFT_436627 [Collybiopsis luxurians FD-317 M1]
MAKDHLRSGSLLSGKVDRCSLLRPSRNFQRPECLVHSRQSLPGRDGVIYFQVAHFCVSVMFDRSARAVQLEGEVAFAGHVQAGDIAQQEVIDWEPGTELIHDRNYPR